MKITKKEDIKDFANFTGICLYPNGDKVWYKNGLKHRGDGPAVEWADGSKFWYKNGVLHRKDGPACEYTDGDKFWYKNGVLHRKDGPAVEGSNDYKEWWLNAIKYTKKEYYKELYELGKISEEQLFLELL